jgi:hypothetical protein
MSLRSEVPVLAQKPYTKKQYRQMWLKNVLYSANREDRAGVLTLVGGLLGGITLALVLAGMMVLFA